MEIDEEVIEKMRKLSIDFAKYKGERVRLDNYKKVLKSRLMTQAQASGVKSATAQEREAYSSKEYEEVCEAIAVATEFETRAYWELHALELKIEIWRTEQANLRSERNKYNA